MHLLSVGEAGDLTWRSALSGCQGRPLAIARAAVLDRLRNQPDPLMLLSLATATGLYENTLREHLGALVRLGPSPPRRTNRSRQAAWLYELGFMPETATGRRAEVRFTHCPLLEVAYRQPDWPAGLDGRRPPRPNRTGC